MTPGKEAEWGRYVGIREGEEIDIGGVHAWI